MQAWPRYIMCFLSLTKLIYVLTFQFSGTTIGALTNLTKVAKQQNRCKEFKRNQSYSKPPTMGTILARTRQTLISYLTPCPLHPLPSSLALTTPFQPHPSKSAPFSHLPIISHHHHQWKGSARRRSLPQFPPMITSSLLTSLLIAHQGIMSLYHQHLTQSTRVWTFRMSCMILLSLMMPLNPSLNLDEHVLVWFVIFFI